MQHIVSIDSQGRFTIPSKIRNQFGIDGNSKARIITHEGKICITLLGDFWSTAGSLASDISLTDQELESAVTSIQAK